MKRLHSPFARVAAVAAAVVLCVSVVTRAQVGPVLAPAVVVGANVSFAWTAVPGATSYVLQAGVAPGNYLVSAPVGAALSTSAAAPAVGRYYARVVAVTPTGNLPSNEIEVIVTSMVAPPAAPAALTTYINGRTAMVTWAPGTGGGNPSSFVLHAGSAPGGTDIGVFPLGLGTQLTVPNLGAGTYHLRLFALNAGGASGPSNDAVIEMPAGGGCSVPPALGFTTMTFGRFVQLAWQPVPTAQYRMDVSAVPGGPVVLSQAFAPGSSMLSVTGAPIGTFYGKLTTGFSCGTQSTGTEQAIVVDGAPPPGPRAPDPAPGQQLPVPNWGQDVIFRLAAERPDLLAQSCVEHGGNNRFMFEAVRRLRAIDNRFGLNWKRGNHGDLSQDIVNYNWGRESDEGTQQVYLFDIIGGHCGSNPTPFWQNQTGATRDAGTIGIWTLLPYIRAGFPIVSDPQ